MDFSINRRWWVNVISLLCCIVPFSIAQDLDGYLQDRNEAVPYEDVLESRFYSSFIGPMDTKQTGFTRAGNRDTRPFFLTTKRGWDVIEKIWQPQFPKRAWEFVDRVWKIPRFRKKYLRYLQPDKRSKEVVVNVPVQPQPETESAYHPPGNYRDNDRPNDRDFRDIPEDWWTQFITEIFCKCCSKKYSETCCAQCDILIFR